MQGLTAFDTNHDKVLDSHDAAFHDFGILLANGTFESLQQAGVTSIALSSDNQMQVQNGNIINGMTTYETSNGSVLSAADVSFGLSVSGNPINPNDVIQNIGQLNFSHLGTVAAPVSKPIDIAALFGIHPAASSAGQSPTSEAVASQVHDASPVDMEHIDHVLKQHDQTSANQ